MKKRILFLAVLFAALTLLPLTVGARDVSYENGLAADLRALGLFQGVSENNFDLERAPSRAEVLVMLIRVLGKEDAAKNGSYTHPFTDVPAWADPYVGYAYENGLTKGVSATKFGTDTATAGTYLTFMLRALGYSDANGDFAWDAPEKLAGGIGLLPPFADTENFWRADIVSISYAALSVQLKGKTITLAQKLVDAGVFDTETFAAAYDNTKLGLRADADKVSLDSETIFDRCSPAVFYIEVKDEKGKMYASGSGFFIREDGVAVTNYHVIEGASSATITIPSTQKKYEVTGIYDFDRFDDWAVVQVDGSGFAALSCNPLPLKTAVTCYAIGSPKGLQNTISAGIISSPRRVLDENGYIQTTAAISGGSSGGVLLNVYGEVVGITCGTYSSGQNLNFACPISCIAGAKLAATIPFAEMTWAEVRYYFDSDPIELAAGEVYSLKGSTDYVLDDWSDLPTVQFSSTDEEVLVVRRGIEYGEIFLAGQSAGSAVLRFTNTLTDDILEIPVTVTGTLEAPKVEYRFYSGDDDEEDTDADADADEAMSIGSSGRVLLVAIPFGVRDVKISMTAEDPKIAEVVEVKEKIDEENPNSVYWMIEMRALAEGETMMTVSNDKTADVYAQKLVVADKFEETYAKLVELADSKGKEYTEDGKSYQRYVLYSESGKSLSLLCDRDKGDILFRISASSPMQVVFTVQLDPNTRRIKLIYQIPAINGTATATITPQDVGVLTQISKYDSYTMDKASKETLKALMPVMATSTMSGVSMWLSIYEDINLDDLGFVNVFANYENE